MTRRGRPSKEMEAAKAWLQGCLSDGSKAVSEIRQQHNSGDLGFSWHTLLRAKAELYAGKKIFHSQESHNEWYWSLTPFTHTTPKPVEPENPALVAEEILRKRVREYLASPDPDHRCLAYIESQVRNNIQRGYLKLPLNEAQAIIMSEFCALTDEAAAHVNQLDFVKALTWQLERAKEAQLSLLVGQIQERLSRFKNID